MEAATAVKIHIVYENDLVELKPLTPNAKHIKNPTIKGPDAAIFPVKIIAIVTINNNAEHPNSML